jgi:hypothetical protein
MIEQAIFNEWIAQELEARGFTIVGKSKLAYFFEDSAELERTVNELLEVLQEQDK